MRRKASLRRYVSRAIFPLRRLTSITGTYTGNVMAWWRPEEIWRGGSTIRESKSRQPFAQRFPQAKPAANLEEILDDASIKLVAAAAVPSERGPLGCRVMDCGKDYFTDKTPFTTLDQLKQARATAARTGKKYMVYYSERLHAECAVLAGQLVQQGAIGRVFQTIGSGPHRLSASSRPAWFFEKARFGGILCDIGSHQSEQFLFFAGANDAEGELQRRRELQQPGISRVGGFRRSITHG